MLKIEAIDGIAWWLRGPKVLARSNPAPFAACPKEASMSIMRFTW